MQTSATDEPVRVERDEAKTTDPGYDLSRLDRARKYYSWKVLTPTVFAIYKADRNGGLAAWQASVWAKVSEELAFDEAKHVPAGREGRRARKSARRLKRSIIKNVDRALGSAMGKLGAADLTAATAVVQAWIVADPGGAFVAGPGGLTDRAWTEHHGFGRINLLGGRGKRAAKKYWRKLHTAVAAAHKGLAKTQATLGPAAGSAEVKTAAGLIPDDKWVTTPAEVEAFLVKLAAALKRDVADLRPAGPAWVAAGEFEKLGSIPKAVEQMIPRGEKAPKLRRESWMAGVRNYYTGLYTVPPWTYFDRHLTAFKIFERETDKNHGLHSEVAATLPLVEKSAMRLAGVTDVMDLPMRPRFYGYRFQLDGVGNNHPRGRAMDMMAKENPMITGSHLTLVSVLSGRWMHEMPRAPKNDRDWTADQVAALAQERIALKKAAEEVAGDPAAKEEADARLRELFTRIDTVRSDPKTKKVTALYEDLRKKIEFAETRLKIAYLGVEVDGEFNAANATKFLTSVQAQVDTKIETETDKKRLSLLRRLKSDLAKEASRIPRVPPKQLIRDTLKDDVAALLVKAKGPEFVTLPKKDPARRAHAKELRAKSRALAKADRAFAGEMRRLQFVGVGGSRANNPTLHQMTGLGILNQPDWLVGAFAENGWGWGGEWSSAKDMMHFEWIRPVTDAKG
ncbi:MAG: M15 family metallopeptidase [Actinomycetia bacterium]|nr:M15 family metallopeptidase [Actinomycetes bacterium]MCP4962755.1 M15 family metallopeptidase [Actinomycetes bacterium]